MIFSMYMNVTQSDTPFQYTNSVPSVVGGWNTGFEDSGKHTPEWPSQLKLKTKNYLLNRRSHQWRHRLLRTQNLNWQQWHRWRKEEKRIKTVWFFMTFYVYVALSSVCILTSKRAVRARENMIFRKKEKIWERRTISRLKGLSLERTYRFT